MKKNETIELRQHEATLDSGSVKRWARFCVGIVQWAKDSLPHIMEQLLLRKLERQDAGNGLKLWDPVEVPLGCQRTQRHQDLHPGKGEVSCF